MDDINEATETIKKLKDGMSPEDAAKLDGLVDKQLAIGNAFQADFKALVERYTPQLVEHYLVMRDDKPGAITNALGLLMYQATEAMIEHDMGDEKGFVAGEMFDRLAALTKGFQQNRDRYAKLVMGSILKNTGEEILKEQDATAKQPDDERPSTAKAEPPQQTTAG